MYYARSYYFYACTRLRAVWKRKEGKLSSGFEQKVEKNARVRLGCCGGRERGANNKWRSKQQIWTVFYCSGFCKRIALFDRPDAIVTFKVGQSGRRLPERKIKLSTKSVWIIFAYALDLNNRSNNGDMYVNTTYT